MRLVFGCCRAPSYQRPDADVEGETVAISSREEKDIQPDKSHNTKDRKLPVARFETSPYQESDRVVQKKGWWRKGRINMNPLDSNNSV